MTSPLFLTKSLIRLIFYLSNSLEISFTKLNVPLSPIFMPNYKIWFKNDTPLFIFVPK